MSRWSREHPDQDIDDHVEAVRTEADNRRKERREGAAPDPADHRQSPPSAAQEEAEREAHRRFLAETDERRRALGGL